MVKGEKGDGKERDNATTSSDKNGFGQVWGKARP